MACAIFLYSSLFLEKISRLESCNIRFETNVAGSLIIEHYLIAIPVGRLTPGVPTGIVVLTC